MPLQPQEAEEIWLVTENTHKLLQIESTIESILSGCITAWYGNCTARNRRALQRMVQSAQCITRGTLPALQDTYSTRCHRKAKKIIKDINHPSHCLFTPQRLKNSVYLKAIILLNSNQ